MKIINYIILIFLCLTYSEFGFSINENIRFRKLNTVDGLNSNVIYSLMQDSKGFVWIGTKEGINRFDGYSLVKYALPPEINKNLAHQRINAICEDLSGNIWFGTSKGIIQLQVASGEMIHHSLRFEKKASQSQYINAIVVSEQNDVWVGTRNGLQLYNPKLKMFEQYRHFPYSNNSISYSKGERVINDLCFDGKGNLWIATAGNGLTILNLSIKKKRLFIRSKKNKSLCSNYIESIFKDSQGVMWLATTNGLNKYNSKKEEFTSFNHSDKKATSLLDDALTTITEDKDGYLWIGSKKGLSQFDRNSGEFHHYQNHPSRSESISSNSILSLLADRSGNFWIGTTQGLNSFYSHNLHFDLYRHIPNEQNSLVDNSLRALAVQASGKIWIGTLKDGINSFNPKTSSFKIYKQNRKKERKHNAIKTAYIDKLGRLLVGTDKGILKYNEEEDRFENFNANGRITFKKGVFGILNDTKGNYWFAEIDRGIWQWNPSTNRIKLFKKDTVSGLNSLNNKVLLETVNGDIWVGTQLNGLYKRSVGEEKFKSYQTSKKEGSLSHNRIFAIFEDSKYNLWIGTGDGLCKYDEKSDTFQKYDLNDGLPGKNILSIQEDSNGRLWLGTNNGLSCFDLNNQQFANFYQEDGLQANIFEYKVSCFHPNGQMYFGGNNGLNAFNPSDFEMNTFVPELKFSKVSSSLGDKIINCEEKDNKQINLVSTEKSVFIELSTDSYVQANKNRYSYRLLPQDSTWNLLPLSNHKIELPDLPIGNYTLEVKVSNNDFKWSPKISRLLIDVSRNWSKESGYLYAIITAVMLGLLTWLGFSRRQLKLKQKSNKNAKKKRILNKVSEKEPNEWPKESELLRNFMKEDRLYRDKRFTKAQLANHISWSEVQLSNILRDGLHTNFNDFINQYRVDEVKERLKNPQSRDYTLIAIAEECGFNSKTSFYRIFKKFTGHTPSEYLDQLHNKD